MPAASPRRVGDGGMTYRLGVDVGGTFTDLFLINDETGRAVTAKVPSTPADSSIGVLNGVARICTEHDIDPADVTHVMHGTTVATNAVLTGDGAKVGLLVTAGYEQILHLARSWVPGGLGAWILFNKSKPLAPLEWTVGVDGRIAADGTEVTPLDEAAVAASAEFFAGAGVEAITIAFINSYANGAHESRARDILAEMLPGLSISASAETVPELQEYERTISTVANSFVRPKVSGYLNNLTTRLATELGDVNLNVLRSDGGLATAEVAAEYPVNLLMSGPAGGVSGAVWIAGQAGFDDIITFDMGGTSTDVALVQDGVAQVRRETVVGDVSVRASSIDVRTVGAGGGSIAHVPELTKALRVGPKSAGADPGPAAYNKGGDEPTVTDANVVLGYLPASARLGGDMEISKALAERAVQSVAAALELSLNEAAEGIVRIVNENMFGALRLVSIEQGYDPRDFALMAFGGAGPLHANALGVLLGSWPVIVPRGPGVLCAAGDATTRMRDEASQTFIRLFADVSATDLAGMLAALSARAAATLDADGVPRDEQQVTYQCDVRYSGQALEITVAFSLAELERDGLAIIGERFDRMHEQYYTFVLDSDKEIVNLRAIVEGRPPVVGADELERGSGDPADAVYATQDVYVDGHTLAAKVYDRAKLRAGDVVAGPAIVTEMDSTTLILPGHHGDIDRIGNILIRPDD